MSLVEAAMRGDTVTVLLLVATLLLRANDDSSRRGAIPRYSR